MDLHPAAANQHRRSEIFLQRRIALRLSPAASMQGAAAKIDGQESATFAQYEIDPKIGRIDIYRRPHAMLGANPVDDCILDALRGKTLMRERGARYVRVDRQGA